MESWFALYQISYVVRPILNCFRLLQLLCECLCLFFQIVACFDKRIPLNTNDMMTVRGCIVIWH